MTTNQAALAFNSVDKYTIVIKVTDTGGNQNFVEVLVSINDINEPPIFAESFGFSVAENSVAETYIGIISADDEDREETHSFYIQNINFESSSSLWVFGVDSV